MHPDVTRVKDATLGRSWRASPAQSFGLNYFHRAARYIVDLTLSIANPQLCGLLFLFPDGRFMHV
jgi:hypothetical protein